MIHRVVALLLALLVSLPLASWFAATMPRHQLLQLPALLVLGIVAARRGRDGRPRGPAPEWDPMILVFALGLIIFWMIPRSLDLAASNQAADQLQHLSWFYAGAALSHTLGRIPFVARMALGIHGVAMVAVVGLVYTLYPGLICTAYNLQQQRVTGRIMLYLASALGVSLWVWAIYRMSARSPLSELSKALLDNSRPSS